MSANKQVRVAFCEPRDPRIRAAAHALEAAPGVKAILYSEEPRGSKPAAGQVNEQPPHDKPQPNPGSYLDALERLKGRQCDVLIAGAQIALRLCLPYVIQVFQVHRSSSLLCSAAVLFWRAEKRTLLLVDPCVVVSPTAAELAHMAHEAIHIASVFTDEPIYTCFLAHSTAGGRTAMALQHDAIAEAMKLDDADRVCSSPLQLDAALVESAARCKVGELARRPNVLVCPDITSANVMYKTLETFARNEVLLSGAILIGLPHGQVGLLPRTANEDEVIRLANNLVRLHRRGIGDKDHGP